MRRSMWLACPVRADDGARSRATCVTAASGTLAAGAPVELATRHVGERDRRPAAQARLAGAAVDGVPHGAVGERALAQGGVEVLTRDHHAGADAVGEEHGPVPPELACEVLTDAVPGHVRV